VIQAEGRFAIKTIEPDKIHGSDAGSNYQQKKETSKEDMCNDLLETAEATLLGIDPEILQDEAKAINLYLKAANLGCFEAYYCLGELFYEKYVYDEKKSDLELAFKYYQEGANNNCVKCWGGMAVCYENLKNISNSDKCWVKLFTHPLVKEVSSNDLGILIYKFVRFMDNSRNFPHEKTLEATYQELKKKGL
jgi:hypothetical protein